MKRTLLLSGLAAAVLGGAVAARALRPRPEKAAAAKRTPAAPPAEFPAPEILGTIPPPVAPLPPAAEKVDRLIGLRASIATRTRAGGPFTEDELAEIMSDEREAIALEAELLAKAKGDPALARRLVEALSGLDEDAALRIARALGPALSATALRRDLSPRVAVAALAGAGDIEGLVAAASDPDPAIRRDAVTALVSQAHQGATAVDSLRIRDALDRVAMADPDNDLRSLAGAALVPAPPAPVRKGLASRPAR